MPAKLLDAYRAEPGTATFDLLLCEVHQQQKLLQNGQASVTLLHLPFASAAGLDTEVLHTEGQVTILPTSQAVFEICRTPLLEWSLSML